MASAPTIEQGPRSGTFANGMEFLTWGSGPRTLLFIQGGPGSAATKKGMGLRMFRRQLDPFVEAGFAVWVVTRRRHMPPGHTVADMADDYAQVITEEFGGRVDLVVGLSYGGMIAQYLAAFHSGSVGHVAIVVAAAEVSDWGKDVDSRMAAAHAAGDAGGAGTVVTEALLPSERMRWVGRLIGPLLGRLMFAGHDCPPEDLLTEGQAEEAFDSRAVLPRIQVPVLLLCGDSDRFFSQDVIAETAELIPDCTLIWYEGQGHMKAASNKRVPRDVLAFVNRS